jgi:hypothetical protein
MKSKISVNYKPKYSIKEINKFLIIFQDILREEVNNSFDVLQIEAPIYSSKTITSEIYELIKSRIIAFGSVTDEETYSLYNRYHY